LTHRGFGRLSSVLTARLDYSAHYQAFSSVRSTVTCLRGDEGEWSLRRLIKDYLVPCPIHIPAVKRLPTAAKSGELVALAAQRHQFGSATDISIGIRRGTG
jgi:hypothetical protein